VIDRLFRFLMRGSELSRYLTSYPAGTAIHRYGEPCTGVLIVKQGAVRISQPLENGRSRTLTIVRTGGAVGLTSCLSETPCRYTAIAETPVTGWFVPIEVMQQRLAEHPEAYVTLIQLLSTSLQEAYVHLLARRVQKSKGETAKSSCKVERLER